MARKGGGSFISKSKGNTRNNKGNNTRKNNINKVINNTTLLHDAVLKENPDEVLALIKAGARVNKIIDDMTELDSAILKLSEIDEDDTNTQDDIFRIIEILENNGGKTFSRIQWLNKQRRKTRQTG